jgi:hypothetical protein
MIFSFELGIVLGNRWFRQYKESARQFQALSLAAARHRG